MEQFMLIFHGGADHSSFSSPDVMQDHMSKWIAWVEKLQKSGHYVSGEPLNPGGKLVSGIGGSTVIDGPFTEGKEVVGGYFVIKANNIDEAVEITKNGYPDFEYGGTIQVRHIMKVDM